MLDIGCGNGASTLMLAAEMKYCLGIDVESTHQPEFEAQRQQQGITNCDYKLHNIELEPLSRQFDRIISFEVMEQGAFFFVVANTYTRAFCPCTDLYQPADRQPVERSGFRDHRCETGHGTHGCA